MKPATKTDPDRMHRIAVDNGFDDLRAMLLHYINVEKWTVEHIAQTFFDMTGCHMGRVVLKPMGISPNRKYRGGSRPKRSTKMCNMCGVKPRRSTDPTCRRCEQCQKLVVQERMDTDEYVARV